MKKISSLLKKISKKSGLPLAELEETSNILPENYTFQQCINWYKGDRYTDAKKDAAERMSILTLDTNQLIEWTILSSKDLKELNKNLNKLKEENISFKDFLTLFESLYLGIHSHKKEVELFISIGDKVSSWEDLAGWFKDAKRFSKEREVALQLMSLKK